MAKRERVFDYCTAVERIGGAQDGKVTTCCCDAPGARSDECQFVSGNKTPCRCACHIPQPYPKRDGLTATKRIEARRESE